MPLELPSSAQPGPRAAPGLLARLNESQSAPGDRDRLLFTERLALLLDTGVSLNAALGALAQQADKPAMAAVLRSLLGDIEEGKAFSAALARHGTFFSSTYVNLVAAGEQGGFLPRVLAELLDMEEKRERLRATLVSALTYPLFLAAFSAAVVVFVLVVVFPKFATLFASIANELPASTLALMWMSNVLSEHWPTVLGVTVAAALGLRLWAATPAARGWLDRARLAIPWVRDFYLWLYLVQSLRVLGLSLGNGVGILDALAACRDVVANRVYRDFVREVELKVREGGTLASGFDAPRMIPALVQQMIATGEQAGNLPAVATRVADFYERELTRRAQALAKAAEPVMLLVMGVVVGLLVSSLILPIFKLSRAVY